MFILVRKETFDDLFSPKLDIEEAELLLSRITKTNNNLVRRQNIRKISPALKCLNNDQTISAIAAFDLLGG